MIKRQVICDRCGENCRKYGTSYYIFDIYSNDIFPTNDGRVSCETFGQNMTQNMTKIFGNDKHYCKRCKDEIEKFIKKVDNTK